MLFDQKIAVNCFLFLVQKIPGIALIRTAQKIAAVFLEKHHLQIHQQRTIVLKTTQLIKNTSVNHLINLWAKRYTPDLSSFSIVKAKDPSVYTSLLEAASLEGRANTALKLHDCSVNNKCQLAGIKTNALYNYIPNVVDLKEARKITHFAYKVYRKLLEIYQQPALIATSPTEKLFALANNSQDLSLSSLGIPSIEQLATALEPLLIKLQEQHIASKDWRTLGFITTQFNFSNKLMLDRLTDAEKALLTPYLKFIEEQVALPWQRVCAAAAKHQLNSPSLSLVTQMFPLSEEIAETVYRRLVALFPNHWSRRGKLGNPDIAHSCIRDLNMFQAYLWLCLLEESMQSVEQELVILCVMVMQGVDVKWELTEQWTKVLLDEILSRLNPQQKELLLPYAQKMQQVFFDKRVEFGAISKPMVIAK